MFIPIPHPEMLASHSPSFIRLTAVCGFVFILLRLVRIIHRELSGPLRHVPGPVLNRISFWPLKIASIRGRRVYYVHDLHQRYGPCVRIAPDEVAVSDSASTKEIHRIGAGYLKPEWYAKFTEEPKGEEQKGMFSVIDPKLHAARRKLFAHGLSKAALGEWEEVLQEKTTMAVAGIKKALMETGSANLLAWFTFMSSDITSTFSFGDSFKCLEAGKKTQFVLDLESVAKMAGIAVELPYLKPILQLLSPRPRLDAKGSEMIGRVLASWEEKGRGVRGNIFTRIVTEVVDGNLTRAQVEREAANFLIAGTDTTAVTLTYLVWAVLSAPTEVRDRIVREVQTLDHGFTSKDALALSYLDCVIQETLRLYGAAQGCLPRVVPKGGAMFDGCFLPAGTTVSTQAYTRHRDPSVFNNPLQFNPDRWISPSREMKDAFMAFGAGTRVCIGSHLACSSIALAAATFFRSCGDVHLAPETTPESMQMENYFLIFPISHRCNVVI